MMKKLLLNSTLLLFVMSSFGQSLSLDRRTKWSDEDGWNMPDKKLLFRDYLNRFQGNCDLAMEAAIQEADPNGTVIEMDSGQFYFSKSIVLKTGISLQGKGAHRTELIFESTDQSGLIVARGGLSPVRYELTHSWKTQQDFILHTSSELMPGVLIKLGFNDAHLITSSWAKGSVSQYNLITRKSGDTLFLQDPIRLENQASEPYIQIVDPVENIMLSAFRIRASFQRSEQISNIEFAYVHKGRIQSVQSDSCMFSHVSLNQCNRVSVSGSYFKEAYDYGSGGKGYGVVLQYGSGNCLVENNIFVKLRHSILLQAGANGNVIAYNYSREPFWTGTSFHSSFAGDMVLHGNYPFLNLFEGNICQNLVIDDSHGQNGPHNTFFRNQIEHFGIFMNASPVSHYQNFINNEITGSGSVKQGILTVGLGNYLLQGQTHVEQWNRTLFKNYPESSNPDPTNSYYLNGQPDFWQKGMNFPFCGGSNAPGTQQNPAWMRYHYNQYKTFEGLNAPDLILTVSGDKNGLRAEWKSQANSPTRNFVLFEQSEGRELLLLSEIKLGEMADTGGYFYEDYRPRSGKYSYKLVQTLGDDSQIESATVNIDFGAAEPPCKIAVTQDGNIRICASGLYTLYDLNGRKICEYDASEGEILPWSGDSGQWYVLEGAGNSTFIRK